MGLPSRISILLNALLITSYLLFMVPQQTYANHCVGGRKNGCVNGNYAGECFFETASQANCENNAPPGPPGSPPGYENTGDGYCRWLQNEYRGLKHTGVVATCVNACIEGVKVIPRKTGGLSGGTYCSEPALDALDSYDANRFFCCTYAFPTSTPTPTPTPTLTPTPTSTPVPTPTTAPSCSFTTIFSISCPASVLTGSTFKIDYTYKDVGKNSNYKWEHRWLAIDTIDTNLCRISQRQDDCATESDSFSVTAPATEGTYTYTVNGYAHFKQDAAAICGVSSEGSTQSCSIVVVAPTPTPTPTPTPHS